MEDSAVLDLVAVVLAREIEVGAEVADALVARQRYLPRAIVRHCIQGNKQEVAEEALDRLDAVVAIEHTHSKRSNPILGADSKDSAEHCEEEEVEQEDVRQAVFLAFLIVAL